MRLETDTTICAIATAEDGAPRGIIRITGPQTLPILGALLEGERTALEHLKRPTVVRGQIQHPVLGRVPVAAHCWPTSRSYTGQPSAELHMLGAPIVLQEIENVILQHGARMAQPGEFTLRAFLAGRMDLTQCEAVLGLIHAKGERSFRVALAQLAGGLASPLKQLRQDLIHLLADIEAGLDFVDEDIQFIDQDAIRERLIDARGQLQRINEQLVSRAGQRVVPQVALVGLPNAGKSSLLNALSGVSIAIANPMPGTTRDFVRSRLRVHDLEFDLLDTAGLEGEAVDGDASDEQANDGDAASWRGALRKEVALGNGGANIPTHEVTPDDQAQVRTRQQFEEADLVLFCASSANDADAMEAKLFREVLESAECPVWWVATKRDLVDEDSLHARGGQSPDQAGVVRFGVSSVTGQGVIDLKQAIAAFLLEQQERAQDVVPMTGERCRDSLKRAEEHLTEALDVVARELGDEVLSGEIRLALSELGAVAGDVVNNDVLDALFSRFCIGK